MAGRRKKRLSPGPFYGFSLTWLFLSFLMPLYRIWAIVLTAMLSGFVFYLLGKNAAKKANKAESSGIAKEKQTSEAKPVKKSYGPDIDPIIEEGNRALSEMGRLYMSIKNTEVRMKINEIMRITDKITQDAIEDPSDIPQIKKFMNYYLPTTLKLVSAYEQFDDMSAQGEDILEAKAEIEKTLDSINSAFEELLNRMFQSTAFDVTTDAQVLQTMLAKEGLTKQRELEKVQ